MLEELAGLELTTDVLPLPEQFGAGGAKINQAHLLKLFPALCECVGVQDPVVQQRVVAILHKVSAQLGLGVAGGV